MAHLARLKGPPPRPRPGSYAWPAIRAAVERALAGGATLDTVLAGVANTDYGHAQPPSKHTVQRWQTQRRWQAQPAPP
jgi:hypothetical protein